MRFELSTPARIMFGRGSARQIGVVAKEFGRHAFVVTGRNVHRADWLGEQLSAAALATTVFSITREPTIEDITTGVAAARAAGCDFVIGIGGGSALDAAKAVGVMLTNPGVLEDYLEVIGRAQPLSRAGAACIAIPTTAGTGAEATRNAVLASPRHRVKVSLRSPLMLPRVACVDPALTDDLPPGLTATTGLDALTQLIEPYVCSRTNPFTDAWCVEGMKRAARSLAAAAQGDGNAGARDDMALASLCGGLALANAGLGAVHGFAGPIGGAFPAPHGAICAALLPGVVAANARALRARAVGHPALQRYDEIARILTGRSQASVEDGVAWLSELTGRFGIPRLSSYGITPADVPALVSAAAQASSMKANPILLTVDECTAILSEAL